MKPVSKIILVAGAPGAGKGTLCKHLSNRHSNGKFLHISAGDICREHVAKKTEQGIMFSEYMRRGEFVPDNMMIEMIRARLNESDAQYILLDGFPRTQNQAQQLCQTIDVDRVVLVNTPDELCTQRIIHRRIDPIVGSIYNMKYAPPPRDVEHRIIQRDGDKNEATIQTRLDTFHRCLPPILGK